MRQQLDGGPDERGVAAYTRVSSEEQVEGTSLDEQARTCRAAALLNEDPLPEVYREEGVTGTTANRPEWQRLLRDCRAGRVRRVYALNWSRLARDSAVGTQMVKELESLQVDLVVVEQHFDGNTLMGDFLRKLMILLAELDRNSLVDRMARGQYAMAARGYWPGGGASPYGYRATGGRENKLVVHESEAATVRLMVSWIVDEGHTTGEVARRLNILGRLTRHGKEWTHSNLRRVLRQRVLVGEVIWGNTEKTHRSYVSSGKYGSPVTLHYEPLIDEGRFVALQTALDARASGKRAGNQPYALSGRLISPCGQPYGGVYRKDRDIRQYRCRCRQWTAKDTPRCGDPLLMADDVEQRVWAEVAALLTDKQRLLRLAQDYLGLRMGQVAAESDELATLTRQVERLSTARNKTLVDLARRGFDAEAIEVAMQAVSSELGAARRRLSDVEAWAAASRQESRQVMQLWELAEVAGERIRTMPTSEQAAVLALLDVRVTVLDDSRRPGLRLEGTVCHEQLLDRLVGRGDLTVAGTPPDGPPRR